MCATAIESELMIGGESSVRLAERFGTPLYVYDAEAIRQAFHRIQQAVPYDPLAIHYACVTNSNLAILRVIRELGGGIHANTWGDAVVALRAGFAPDDIMYTGSNLGRDDMLEVMRHGVSINLNSLSQVRNYGARLRRFEETGGPRPALRQVGLRMHLDDQKPYSRMGVTINEIDEAKAIAREMGLSIAGVHYYRGTGTSNTEHFLKPFPGLIDAARRFGDTLQYVDVGGGFGFQYMPAAPTRFEWEHFGEHFAALVDGLSRELGRRLRLILEPGRSVVAAAGYLLTRVVGVDPRPAGGQVAGVDTTTSHISSETYRVYGGYRRIVLANRGAASEPIPTDVVGCTTFSDDYIGRASRGVRNERGMLLPPLAEGDLLAVLDAGGYGFAFASNFLNKPRPAEVLVDGGEARLVRRRETYDDMLRLQLFEPVDR
jgi:diaminopimelate decarboxylase